MGARIHKISKHAPSIFQGRLNFDTARHGLSLMMEHPYERILARCLTIAVVTLVAGYLYFVSGSVLNVMARKDALTQVTKIQGAIGGLEQQYFALSQDVTPSTGGVLGLAPVENTQYVYRPGNVGAATIGPNAI